MAVVDIYLPTYSSVLLIYISKRVYLE